MTDPLHSLGLHAQSIAQHTSNERMQAILQWVGVGSVILMGLAATAHLVKDVSNMVCEPHSKRKHAELLDKLDRHYSRGRTR
jgi:hypothetical protein